jgi:hypothetical protein
MQSPNNDGDLEQMRAQMRFARNVPIWKKEAADLKAFHTRTLVEYYYMASIGIVATLGIGIISMMRLGDQRRSIEQEALKIRADLTTAIEEVNTLQAIVLDNCEAILQLCAAIEKRWGRKSKRVDALRLEALKLRWESWKNSNV